jgi:glycine/D-amino acid oxidase-like deaminating enzyme
MSVTEALLLSLMKLAAPLSYPISLEKIDIDDNQALWTDYTPDYQPSPSLQNNIEVDLAIIGGGFTGVSTAYHFSERFPDKKIAILEAKTLANGASGRNGGMMLNRINGSENLDDEALARIYNTTNYGIDQIIAIINKHKLNVNHRRDGSLQVFTHRHSTEEAQKETERANKNGIPYQYLDAEAVKQYINLQGVLGAILDPNEGQLNGAQYVRALRQIILDRGVEIYESTPVLKIKPGAEITLITQSGTVHAKAIVLATNGYSGKLGYFRKGVFPLHSHVFGTASLTDQQLADIGWKSVAGFSDDLDRLAYCSLTPDNRIVFGGGSNNSYNYLFNNKVSYRGNRKPALEAMKQTLFSYFPSIRDIEVTHLWTGTLAISFQRNCSIGVTGEHHNIYYGLGYSGHGVTLANLAGEVITDIYSQSDEKWRDLPFYQADFAAIPLEPFRWMGYKLFTGLIGRSPRL